MKRLGYLLSGLLFGAGLVVSDMINPARVIAFLDLGGDWDPTLAFVMAGALLVTFPAFAWLRRRGRSLWGGGIEATVKGRIDARLLLGSAIFGLGWGMAGICPGPALAQLVQPSADLAWFLGFLLLGQLLARRLTVKE